MIYERRGLSGPLAHEVATELTRHDALAAHARDELGLEEERRAQPVVAAWASALSFSAGAVLPLIAIGVVPAGARIVVCIVTTLIALAVLGDIGARLGGARRLRAAIRVLVWGAAAMAVTSAIGALVGAAV
jgi:vacuolar iron transporter family protein